MTDFVVVVNGAETARVVAGLSLVERSVRFAKAAGAARVWLVGDTAAVPEVGGVSVMRAEGDWTTGLSAGVHVTFASTVIDRRFATDLAHEDGTRPIVWCAVKKPAGLYSAPKNAVAEAVRSGALVSRATFESFVRELGASDAGPNEARIALEVVGDQSAKAAEDQLWESCRKPVDGIISRNLNRHVSLFISRRIAHTGISPNHVSIVCLGLGFAAAIVALGGTYWHLLAAATIFKLNSILDGVDGELARVKFAHSKLGELLDSAGDNVANFSFFGALSYVCLRNDDVVFGTIGVVGLSLWALYLVFLYSRLYALGRGDVLLVKTALDRTQNTTVAKVVNFFQTILRRDSFVMLAFILAVFGAAKFMLPVMLGGASITFGRAVVDLADSLLRSAKSGDKAS
jgi:phosphatidylglycerophosphate synthase